MNLYNPITLLQPNFDIDQSKKNNLIQTMTIYKNMIQTNAKIPTPINRPPISNAPRFSYISGAKFFSHIMRVYVGGFRLAIMRVYICGKIFALHNTHIKHGENPKIIMRKTASNP